MAARRGNEQQAQTGDGDVAKPADDEGKAEHQYECGIVRPIAAFDGYTSLHWEEVEKIIVEALEPVGFKVGLVSADDAVSVIHGRIVRNLAQNDLVIVDVSGKNPNVMLELGLRLAFDKPVMVIKDTITDYSFDTSPIEHMTYPVDLHYFTMRKFADDLARKAVATVRAPGTPGYQSFLQNFTIQTPAKGLASETVDSAEYLVGKIQELQDTIDKLAYSQRNDATEGFVLSSLPAGKLVRTRRRPLHFSVSEFGEDTIRLLLAEINDMYGVWMASVETPTSGSKVLVVNLLPDLVDAEYESLRAAIRSKVASLRTSRLSSQ